MRKSREETAETRKRILNVAAREFRQNGMETGLAEVMAAAGLTQGGFYKHFGSKAELVCEALELALDAEFKALEKVAESGSKGIASIASAYLSERHRDDVGKSCPFSALGSELARADKGTRAAATAGLKRMIDIVADRSDARRDVARKRATVAVATLIGAITMARISDDPELSSQILKLAERHVTEL
jgi:Transcriptional regulator